MKIIIITISLGKGLLGLKYLFKRISIFIFMKNLISLINLALIVSTSLKAGQFAPLPFYNVNTAPGVGNFTLNDPGLKTRWEGRQQTFTNSWSQDQGAFIFLGDSITEAANLSTLFPTFHVANRGIGNETTRGMLYRTQDNVVEMNPQGLILLGGTNDLHQAGGNPINTAQNIKSIVEAYHAANPDKWVAVLKILPMSIYSDSLVNSYNAAVDLALVNKPYVIRVDTFSLFQNPTKTPNGNNSTASTTMLYDGVHPNAAGYQAYAALMTPVLNQMLTPIPEVSTGLLGAAGALVMLRRRRA